MRSTVLVKSVILDEFCSLLTEVTGTFGPEAASVDLRPDEFDNVMAINCRGVWMCSREVTKRMKLQDPLPTHDGRPGYRGSIVNIASNLGLVCLPRKSKHCIVS